MKNTSEEAANENQRDIWAELLRDLEASPISQERNPGFDCTTRRRLATAYHEAGHVTVAIPHKFAIRRVTIQAEGDYLGLTVFAEGLTARIASAMQCGDYPPELRDEAERYIITALAGPIAQKMYTGEDNIVGAGGDLDLVTQLLLSMTRDAKEAAYYYDWLRVRAERQVEQLWDRIEVVATALYQETTLEEDSLRALFSRFE